MAEENVHHQESVAKTLIPIIGLASLGAFAALQFYVFTVFKDVNGVVDVQGGTVHLWLAIGSALVMCVAGFFLFSGFLRHNRRNEIHITSPGQAPSDGRIRRDIL